MGHTPGVPCLIEDPDHDGNCSTPLPSGFVDLARTRWFEVVETRGNRAYWRTNASAPVGNQVEHRFANGTWHKSFRFDTEDEFLRSITSWESREITAEEVPNG